VQVGVQCADGQLCFTIDDDGPGIAPELRQRMFARGVQLDEQRPGSGLGLDIVRTLATPTAGASRYWTRRWAAHACACGCPRRWQNERQNFQKQ